MIKSLIYWISGPNPESDSQNLKPHHGDDDVLTERTNDTSKLDLEKHRLAQIITLEFINQLFDSIDRPRIKKLTEFSNVSKRTLDRCDWNTVVPKNLELALFYLGPKITDSCVHKKNLNYIQFLSNLVSFSGRRLIKNRQAHGTGGRHHHVILFHKYTIK